MSYSDEDLTTLGAKVDRLIAHCERVDRENRLLKASEASWRDECRRIRDRDGRIRERLKSILLRLENLADA